MTRMLTRRDVLKGIGGVAAAGAVGSLGSASPVEAQRRFDGETLRVQFWAGSEGQTIRSGVVDPFVQKTGAKVVVAEGWTSASIPLMHTGSGHQRMEHGRQGTDTRTMTARGPGARRFAGSTPQGP